MRRLAFVVLLAAGASACTTTRVDLPSQAALDLRGRTIVKVVHPPADFVAVTAGKAPFGLLGQLMMIDAGNALARDHGIDDPALAVGDTLAGWLAANRGMVVVPTDVVASGHKLPSLLAEYEGVADYLLDVRTADWRLFYYPLDWTHYRVSYGAHMRLIHAASGEVVAQSACDTTQGNDADPPTMEELLADDAAVLESFLRRASVACAGMLAPAAVRP